MNRKSIRSLTLVALVLLVVASLAPAQTAPTSAPPDMDAYAARVRKAFDVPGLAVAIGKDGKVVFAKGYGVRELGEPTPVDENTLFSIASNTKAFTAAAATKSERMRRGQTTPTTEAPQIQRTLGYALCLRCLCGFLSR